MTKFSRSMTPAEFIAAVYAEQAELEAEQALLDAHSLICQEGQETEPPGTDNRGALDTDGGTP